MATSADLELRTATADDAQALVPIHGHAFAFAEADTRTWLEATGLPNLRVIARGPEVLAGVGLVPMGQFFGGRSVPMTGVVGVIGRPDVGRQGVVTTMMREVIRELHRRGVALSTLYASTKSLYRKVGYEMAGGRYQANFTPLEIAVEPAGAPLRLRLATEADASAVHELYARVARHRPGHLDRGVYIWNRITKPRFGLPAHGVVIEGSTGLEGYVYYRKATGDFDSRFRHVVRVSDMIASTGNALRRAWTFLADLGTMVRRIEMPTAPSDPAYLALTDPRFGMELMENFLLRIVHVPAALGGRGWPASLRAEFELAIDDEVVPANAGRWIVRIEDGTALVRRGGTGPGGAGTIGLDVRALASLYSGFASPDQLAAIDRIAAAPAQLDLLGLAFAGPPPWSIDPF